MKRLGYFEKLSLAARWFLPNEEAESVIDDYREILGELSSPEEAFERFGEPWRAALAADKKSACRWHFVFLVFSVLLFIPYLLILKGVYSFSASMLALTALTVLLLLWLGVGKPDLAALPKGVAVSFGIAVLFLAVLCGSFFYISGHVSDSVGPDFGHFLVISVFIFSLFGMAGIVCARMFDRRWRAVTVLSITVILVSICFLSLIRSMEPISDPAGALEIASRKCVVISVCGVLVSGVFVC